jgi:hypothetical protein
LAVISNVVQPNPPKATPEERKAQEPREAENERVAAANRELDKEHGVALYVCQALVRKRLNFPLTAQFSSTEIQGGLEAKTGNRIVIGQLEAKNAFGVPKIMEYQCLFAHPTVRPEDLARVNVKVWEAQ